LKWLAKEPESLQKFAPKNLSSDRGGVDEERTSPPATWAILESCLTRSRNQSSSKKLLVESGMGELINGGSKLGLGTLLNGDILGIEIDGVSENSNIRAHCNGLLGVESP
jgi:hypothetical protein